MTEDSADGSNRLGAPVGRPAGAVAVLDPGSRALERSGDLAVARRHVEAAAPGDASHEAARKRILAFLASHPDALHRSCAEGHLTGSAMVVDPQSRRFLLLLHAKIGRWLQPGGHADGDAALPAVALKEATEETGIDGLRVAAPAVDLDVHEFVAPNEPRHLHLDVRYLVLAPLDAQPVRNHESHDLRWVSLDEADDYDLDPGTVRLARAALTALGDLRI